MPILLEDLAEEASASNRRLADRLDTEVRDLTSLERHMEELQQQASESTEVEEIRHRVVESARQANAYAVARLPQSERAWQLALAALRNNPTAQDARRFLRTFLGDFEAGQRLVHSARVLWTLAQKMGADAEQQDELEDAEKRFEQLAAEAKLGLAHRTREWQPSDPARFVLGLQLAREGKTVPADEARTRFRRTPS